MAFSSRSIRFVDTKYEISASVRPHYQPNPHATKEITSIDRILDLLDKELEADILYDKIWKKATREFKQKSRQLERNSYLDDDTPDECYIAIIAYTLDTTVKVDGENLKLYSEFNETFAKLTTDYAWRNFPYRSLHYLLMMAQDGVCHIPNISSRAYRGINYQFNPRKIKINDDFYFDNYSSFSTSRQRAESFSGEHGTLIELPRGAARACGISKYSVFDENEILVFPTSRFYVKEFRPSGAIHKLVLERDGSID